MEMAKITARNSVANISPNCGRAFTMAKKSGCIPPLKSSQAAVALHAKLATVDISEVTVMSLDRSIRRKEQAALARQLLKQLGIKGVSVTAPNYSMAQSVDVSLPKRDDYVFDKCGFVVEGDAARLANNDADSRVRSLLLAAFPRHDDRSETQSDYFDFKWSVS